ncbi:MAG: electron transport complex subunit RsxA [Actinobacteria bacterium]|nr:electron transport complex subunit RsxA [Actinomycetota bacterium]MBU4302000.1 electron transport complex subunit RsxA [Actinomycetota bacterium]MBU4386059.1 electron transport complex subunit RsxA [Actinomycetota bacterium]MCG2796065.1 electron transport complex subunit RsxA [Actinomycetes bacterium]
MSEPYRYFLIFIGATVVYNIVLIRFIALCPLFGVSSQVETSIGMAMSVMFVMTMATTVSWLAWNYVLEPLHVGEFLYIPVFILIIATLVQFLEMVLKKVSPPLYRAMGIFLPLITTNCAVLAVATEAVKPGFLNLNVAYHFSLPEALVYTIGVAIGFGLVIVVFACIRERLETSPVPHAFRGAPIAFMTAALLSLAFMGFTNLLGL